MKQRWVHALATAALAPLAVSVSPALRDSSVTSLTVGAGAGDYAYVTRGCDNGVLSKEGRHLRESGFAVEHDFPGPAEIGVRATVLNEVPEYSRGSVVVNPHVAMEWGKVGIGGGYVFVPEDRAYGDPDYDIVRGSGHLRFGSRIGTHVSFHLNEDVPLTVNGGAFRMGLGFRPMTNLNLWLGAGDYPYDQLGFIARADIHATRNLDIHAAGRLGRSEGLDENAAAIGLTWKFIHAPRGAAIAESTATTGAP